jgi:hypothetical protein
MVVEMIYQRRLFTSYGVTLDTAPKPQGESTLLGSRAPEARREIREFPYAEWEKQLTCGPPRRTVELLINCAKDVHGDQKVEMFLVRGFYKASSTFTWQNRAGPCTYYAK